MDDEELFRRVQSKKNKTGVGVPLVQGQDYRKEAEQLIDQINPDCMEDRDLEFVGDLQWQMSNSDLYQPTQRQIFWLRDLRDKSNDNYRPKSR